MKVHYPVLFAVTAFAFFTSWKFELKDDASDYVQYEEVYVGKQVWMKKNLNVSVFSNGDSIFNARTNQEWDSAGRYGIPAWCYYDNDSNYAHALGKLYNWFAVSDERGLAPEGWRIPTKEDFDTLMHHVDSLANSNQSSEDILRCRSWVEIPADSCFHAKYGGDRYPADFSERLSGALYWSNTENLQPHPNVKADRTAFLLWVGYPLTGVHSLDVTAGQSVRCINDYEEK